MNILVFSPYYPPHIGGLESHSDQFNKYLSQKGVTIRVFTPHLPAGSPSKEERYQNVKVIRFPAWELFHNYPVPKFWDKRFWQDWSSLSDFPCQIVLSRTRFFFTSLMAWRFARKKHVPWIHIEHGSGYVSFGGKIKTLFGRFYDNMVGRSVLRGADRVVANSKASAEFVSSLAQRADCQVIYRGVEKEAILRAEKIEHEDIATSVPIIGFVGRLVDGKGALDLLNALSMLPHGNFQCLIIGDGPARSALEKISKHARLEERVFFLGQKPWREVIGYLKSFDIFVNPSHTEGIPTAVIDAAICQKAIIATAIGGTTEIISGDGDGFLIPPKNPVLLAQKLSELLADKNLRRAYGQKAARSVECKFSWDEAVQRYLALFF